MRRKNIWRMAGLLQQLRELECALKAGELRREEERCADQASSLHRQKRLALNGASKSLGRLKEKRAWHPAPAAILMDRREEFFSAAAATEAAAAELERERAALRSEREETAKRAELCRKGKESMKSKSLRFERLLQSRFERKREGDAPRFVRAIAPMIFIAVVCGFFPHCAAAQDAAPVDPLSSQRLIKTTLALVVVGSLALVMIGLTARFRRGSTSTQGTTEAGYSVDRVRIDRAHELLVVATPRGERLLFLSGQGKCEFVGGSGAEVAVNKQGGEADPFRGFSPVRKGGNV